MPWWKCRGPESARHVGWMAVLVLSLHFDVEGSTSIAMNLPFWAKTFHNNVPMSVTYFQGSLWCLFGGNSVETIWEFPVMFSIPWKLQSLSFMVIFSMWDVSDHIVHVYESFHPHLSTSAWSWNLKFPSGRMWCGIVSQICDTWSICLWLMYNFSHSLDLHLVYAARSCFPNLQFAKSYFKKYLKTIYTISQKSFQYWIVGEDNRKFIEVLKLYIVEIKGFTNIVCAFAIGAWQWTGEGRNGNFAWKVVPRSWPRADAQGTPGQNNHEATIWRPRDQISGRRY